MMLETDETPRKPRAMKDTHSITESHEILDGAVKLIRTTKSGNFWSMSCWLREEGKCYRKSLRTRSLEEAIELAREKYFSLKADIKAGNRIYSKTVKELIDEFVQYKQQEANSLIITPERVDTVRISLNRWFLKFLGSNKKLDTIHRNDFEGYFTWRRKEASSVRNATLVNERALISSIFKFGISRGYLRHDQTPDFPRLNIKKSNVERRDEFDEKEWEQLYQSFRRWLKNAKDEKEETQRRFIRDFVLISANTGLRFGEMRKLKWHMVKTYEVSTKNKRGELEKHVEIRVPDDTKTGRRTAIGRRGDLFDRIKTYSKHKKYDDWIFVDNETGEQIHKKVFYKQWAILLKEAGLDSTNKKLTYYSLRHTYITFRLIEGVDVFSEAQKKVVQLIA